MKTLKNNVKKNISKKLRKKSTTKKIKNVSNKSFIQLKNNFNILFGGSKIYINKKNSSKAKKNKELQN